MITNGEKVCPRCGTSKPVSEFSPDRSKSDGCRSICRACDRKKAARYYVSHRAGRASYYDENRERIHARNEADRARAIAVYGGVCVACGATEQLEFDHIDDDGGEHRQIELATVMVRRIARTGCRIDDHRLRLLCRTCHRGPGWQHHRANLPEG